MKSPSATLAVDTNILLAAVLGQRTREVLDSVGERLGLVTSSEAASEAFAVVGHVGLPFPEAERDMADLLGQLDVRPSTLYAARLPLAETVLRNAVASRNASVSDAHVLALAWIADADIWSHDRDFAGTGWRSWSSANLLAALATDETG